MKDIMLMSKQLKEKRGDKGFTLMEMLIVVAIIAILIAIAIPVFTSQLNGARVGADEANIRSGYALAITNAQTAQTEPADGATCMLNLNGTVTDWGSTTTGTFRTQGAPTANVDISGITVTAWAANQAVTYTWHSATDTITIGVAAV